MVEREPPYPPPPRTAPADLGRDPGGPVARLGLGLLAVLVGAGLFYAAPLLVGWLAVECLVAEDLDRGVRVLLFLVLAPVALLLLKSYLPRRLPVPGELLVARDQRTLAAFVERVAEDIGSR